MSLPLHLTTSQPGQCYDINRCELTDALVRRNNAVLNAIYNVSNCPGYQLMAEMIASRFHVNKLVNQICKSGQICVIIKMPI